MALDVVSSSSSSPLPPHAHTNSSADLTPAMPKTCAITTLLSQYQTLQLICQHLSSADIIHLAETSKTHWTYVAGSDSIRKLLMAQAHCDGRGIVAQAKVFGYWGGDPSKAELKCLGDDARQCSDCGAQVCNNCRFHFVYGAVIRGSWDDEDEEDDDWDRFIAHSIQHGIDPPRRTIESLRADDLFYTSRRRVHCQECEPLIPNADWCECSLYRHFIRKRWLCLPCFFAEEAKVHSIRTLKVTKFVRDHDLRDPWYCHGGYWEVELCDCGKPARKKGELVLQNLQRFDWVSTMTDIFWTRSTSSSAALELPASTEISRRAAAVEAPVRGKE